MSDRHKLLRGSIWLSVAQLTAYSASFLRNVLVARTLTKEDFGIAACLSLTFTALEFANKLSIGQLIVQNKAGEGEGFLATAHGAQFSASLISGILLAMFSKPMASMFGVSEVAWAFFLLSVISVLGGLQSFSPLRAMRKLSFKKRAVMDLVPDLLLLAAAYPFLIAFADFRSVLALLILKAATSLALSHFLAESPYRLGLSRAHLRVILAFSIPLYLNGMLMFAYQQGDQILIGATYSLADLAVYSIAVSLTMVPGYMIQSVLNSVSFPWLAGAQEDPVLFRSRYIGCLEFATLLSAIMIIMLSIAGEPLIRIAYGSKYSTAGAIVAWLGVANSFRILRGVPTLAAMATGDTISNLIANSVRVISLLFTVFVIVWRFPLVWVAGGAVLGELLALTASTLRLHTKLGISWRTVVSPILVLLCVTAACSALLILGLASASAMQRFAVACAVALVVFSFLSMMYQSIRKPTGTLCGRIPFVGPRLKGVLLGRI